MGVETPLGTHILRLGRTPAQLCPRVPASVWEAWLVKISPGNLPYTPEGRSSPPGMTGWPSPPRAN